MGFVSYQFTYKPENKKHKVTYGTKMSAEKAASSMTKKVGVHFSNYKCLHCDGYHVGKNRTNAKLLSQ